LIQGHVSKRVIRSWLENYQSLVGGDIIPELISNSGPKEYDGIPSHYFVAEPSAINIGGG